jgi:hypothetical protein
VLAPEGTGQLVLLHDGRHLQAGEPRLLGADIDVEARLFTVTGQRGVAPLAVERVRTEHEHPVHGRALRAVCGVRCAVCGHGVAVLEVAVVEIAGIERCDASVVEGDCHGAVVVVDFADAAPLPVGHAVPAVVAAGDDTVAS